MRREVKRQTGEEGQRGKEDMNTKEGGKERGVREEIRIKKIEVETEVRLSHVLGDSLKYYWSTMRLGGNEIMRDTENGIICN